MGEVHSINQDRGDLMSVRGKVSWEDGVLNPCHIRREGWPCSRVTPRYVVSCLLMCNLPPIPFVNTAKSSIA